MMSAMLEFRDETLGRLEKLSGAHAGLELNALRDKIFEDKCFAEKRERICGELFGLDLYDVVFIHSSQR